MATSGTLIVEMTGQPGISEERPLTEVTGMPGVSGTDISVNADSVGMAAVLMRTLIPEWDNGMEEFNAWLESGTPVDVRYRYGRYVEIENLAPLPMLRLTVKSTID